MNGVTWVFIAFLIAIVGYKNQDKIKGIISNFRNGNKGNNSNGIRINASDIEKLREEELQHLKNRKYEIEMEIEELIKEHKADIKEIDLRICLITKQEVPKERSNRFRK